VYEKRSFSTDIFGDTIDELCKSCFRCVQGCPKRLIHKTINPEWEALGDELYTPEVISANWEQAETGKIPVSGAGYGGPFCGAGFDSMWTDMSEIVRPTRDGIHGREYISTLVDLGRKAPYLILGQGGSVASEPLPRVRIPLPVVFDLLPFGDLSPNVWEAIASAAARLQTMAVMPWHQAARLGQYSEYLAPFVGKERPEELPLSGFRMIEIEDHESAKATLEKVKAQKPDLVVSVRMGASSDPSDLNRIVELHSFGYDVIHYAAQDSGYEQPGFQGAHLKDMIRQAHAGLLQHAVRDEIALLASGGIAMAEHVIKAMLCGANAVGVDVPLLMAMGCRVCRECVEGRTCPVSIGTISPPWGVRRIINLMGAWHNQFLEMMGAMGIREARRLTGEQGRVMFFEDLERDTFAQLFSGS
jgi:ferredoxin